MITALRAIDVEDLGMPSMIVRTGSMVTGQPDLLLLDAALTDDQRTTILSRLLEALEEPT
jgi:hypothetical protein